MNRRIFIARSMAMAAGLPASEQAFDLQTCGFAIPCKLAGPATGRPKGAILLLPGSLFIDVDGDMPAMGIRPHAYADIAGQLAALGWASLRMAKIGPGTGSRVVDADVAGHHANFAARETFAAAALARLRASAPHGPAIVAGHSEGALVANLLAARRSRAAIQGVISLSGPAVRLLDILRGQVAAMAGAGEPPPDISKLDAAIAAIRAGEPLPPGAASNPQTAMLASMPPMSLAYLADVDRIDPLVAAAAVRQPMLLIQGGRDDSVTPDQVDALSRARGRRPTAVRKFPELTHFYKVAPAGITAQASMALSTQSDPAVAAAMASWCDGL